MVSEECVSGDEDYLPKTQDVKQSIFFTVTQGNIIICHVQYSTALHSIVQYSIRQSFIRSISSATLPQTLPLALTLSPARVVSCLSGCEGRTELALFL
jgi:hypothetical protein